MWLVAIGVVAAASQLILTQALREAETSVVMPLFFFQLVWLSVIGFAFFGEVPSLFAWIGGAMIIAPAARLSPIAKAGPKKRCRRWRIDWARICNNRHSPAMHTVFCSMSLLSIRTLQLVRRDVDVFLLQIANIVSH